MLWFRDGPYRDLIVYIGSSDEASRVAYTSASFFSTHAFRASRLLNIFRQGVDFIPLTPYASIIAVSPALVVFVRFCQDYSRKL